MRAERDLELTRREALGGAATLLIAFLPSGRAAAAVPSAASPTAFGAWLAVAEDGRLRVAMPGLEMGQGSSTAIAKVLVDELGGDFDRTDVFLSPADPAFVNPKTKDQSTGRSMGVRGYYDLMRKVGAQAREMFKSAAAARTGVAPDRFVVENGRVRDAAGGRDFSFAELAAEAARLPVPADPPLKDRKALTLVGKRTISKDCAAKTAGRAVYASDVKLPGMLVATVKHSPVSGGKPLGSNADAVMKMPGVRAIVPVGGDVVDMSMPYEAGLAVVADSFWQAKLAADALEVRWSPGRAAGVSSQALKAARTGLSDRPAIAAVEKGDVAAADRSAARRLDVSYDVPFLAHATMEPMSCVAHVEADRTTLWAPSQHPLGAKRIVAGLVGQPAERVTVNRTFAGGGFGRRWQRDFVVQAAQISKAVGRPVKLLWTREEDMQHDFYRPGMGMRARASFDADRRLTGLRITTIGPSLAAWQRAQQLPRRADTSAVAGIDDMHYALEPLRVEWVEQETPFPIGVWRSVGHSQNGFFLEGLIDELAHASGEDPYRFRRRLLAGSPRMQRVLDTVAERIGWGRKLPKGRGLGLAIMECYGSYTAHAAQVTVRDGALSIDRMVAAIDCGLAVDPYNIEAQIQGGTIFGLSALHNEISMTDGKVDQGYYTDYPILTLADTPPVEVTVLETDGVEIGGVGESGVPTAVPAVTNAIFAATGKRIRSLPLAKDAL